MGTCLALAPDDYVAGTYRGHGHALAKGTAPEPLVAEMLGRATGVCGGRAGSMNVIDLEHGLIGCYGIVGGSIAAALGAALSAKRQGRVSVAFFGDGAANQALLPRVPEHGQGPHAARRVRVREQLLRRVHADGRRPPPAPTSPDARARTTCRPRSSTATTCGRSTPPPPRPSTAPAAAAGPTLLECQTYRHYGHSKSDPAPYRPQEEVERWLARDPLKLARARLLDEGCHRGADRRGRGGHDGLIEHAVEAALAAPYPDPDAEAATEFRP